MNNCSVKCLKCIYLVSHERHYFFRVSLSLRGVRPNPANPLDPLLVHQPKHYRSADPCSFHKPPKHQQCVKQCKSVPLRGAGSEFTTVTVNNSTQPVIRTVCRHQRPDQLLTYQECHRRASVLENGSQERVCQAFCPPYDIV